MLVVAVVSLTLLLLMAIWIARNIGSSASDAANNLSLLASGKGSLSTKRRERPPNKPPMQMLLNSRWKK